MTASLSQQEAFDRIRLLRSPNIGPVSYRQLLRRFGTAGAALEALPDLAARGTRSYRAASVSVVEAEAQAVRTAGARYVFHDMADYPALLAQMDSPPPILTLRGDLALAAQPCVALVGARNASAAAVKLARDFSAALAQQGFTVVSGLAKGIDGAAHEGALGVNGGTVGVIASGIDITIRRGTKSCRRRWPRRACCWPRSHREPARAASCFPSATASSPASRSALWWSRRRPSRAR